MAMPTSGLLATGLERGDNGFAQPHVAQTVQTGRFRFAVCSQTGMEFDELALEGFLVGRGFDGTPGAGCTGVTTFQRELGWHVAQERRRERQREAALGAVEGELLLVPSDAWQVHPRKDALDSAKR